MWIEADCYGRLLAARLEPVAGSTSFATDRDLTNANGSLLDRTGDDGKFVQIQPLPRTAAMVTANRIQWGPTAGTPDPFLEWWRLDTHIVTRPLPTEPVETRVAIPPIRFTAEFAGFPPFTIVLKQFTG